MHEHENTASVRQVCVLHVGMVDTGGLKVLGCVLDGGAVDPQYARESERRLGGLVETSDSALALNFCYISSWPTSLARKWSG